jgi:hypothetical protein
MEQRGTIDDALPQQRRGQLARDDAAALGGLARWRRANETMRFRWATGHNN